MGSRTHAPHGVPRCRNEGMRPAGEEGGGDDDNYPSAWNRCLLLALCRCGRSCTFFVANMKISQCKANTIHRAHTCSHAGFWMNSRWRARGRRRRAPNHDVQGRKRLRGCRPQQTVLDWLDWSVVRGAASAIDLGLGKIPPWPSQKRPSSPTHFLGGGTTGRSLPRPYPSRQAQQHIQLHTRFSPSVSSSLPLFSASSCVRHSPLRS